MNHEPASTQAKKISISIVDSRALSREGLNLLIDQSAELECLGAFASLVEAIPGATIACPDVVILSLDHEPDGAFERVAELAREAPGARIILVTGLVRDEDVRSALDADVAAVVYKGGGFEEITRAIHAVHAGEYHYSPEILDRIGTTDGEPCPSQSSKTRYDLLSPRERELLVVLASGKTLREACGKMNMTYKTADKHKVSLMKKLGIHDRVSLARYAIREGIVDI